ncbi:MAG: histidine triad nucleotide-binding protein [bacterium]
MDCTFCRIISREMKADIVYEDDYVVAFEDVNPQAPFHILVAPRKHISTFTDITENDKELVGHMIRVANVVAQERGVAERGFRIVGNCRSNGGQTIYHLHFHVLGGRRMMWPPG